MRIWTPPEVVHDPGAECAADRRQFQGISSLACGGNGRAWAVWYGGKTPGENRNNYVILAMSEDGGQTWNERLIVDPDREGPVRAFDPEIWQAPDGNLWIFWAQSVESLSWL